MASAGRPAPRSVPGDICDDVGTLRPVALAPGADHERGRLTDDVGDEMSMVDTEWCTRSVDGDVLTHQTDADSENWRRLRELATAPDAVGSAEPEGVVEVANRLRRRMW